MKYRTVRSLLAVPLLGLSLGLPVLAGCKGAGTSGTSGSEPAVGEALQRRGDEIMVAGTLVHTGAPVVLWFDAGGYDAYRVDARFAPPGQRGWDTLKETIHSPQRYNERPGRPEGGWTPGSLAGVVDQFVLHYDVCGVSQVCFKVLHDLRGLSVHFMLDIDGTIYQTLDVKERAWHATKANGRSVGVEIANIGAYPPADDTLDEWYPVDALGPRIQLPERFGNGGVRTKGFVGRPARPERADAVINASGVEMHELTLEQYVSLVKLTAALNATLPGIRLIAPRDPSGSIEPDVLPSDRFESYGGVLGHWHVQRNKIDPGPGLDWDLILGGARAIRDADGNPDAGERYVHEALQARMRPQVGEPARDQVSRR